MVCISFPPLKIPKQLHGVQVRRDLTMDNLDILEVFQVLATTIQQITTQNLVSTCSVISRVTVSKSICQTVFPIRREELKTRHLARVPMQFKVILVSMSIRSSSILMVHQNRQQLKVETLWL